MSKQMIGKVLVTGGAGFIGSNLVKQLERSNKYEPVSVDIVEADFEEALHIQCDIKNTETLEQVIEEIDPHAVVHMASNESVSYSVDHPEEVIKDIVAKATSVCEASRGIADKLINISTTHVYGDSCNRPSKETYTPQPDSPYAVAKLSAEEIVNQYYQRGMNTVNLRYDTCYGPGMPGHMLFDDILEDCDRGGPIELFGTGENTRAFTYVKDIVTGTILAINTRGISGMTFNIGCGERVTLKQAAELIRSAYGIDCTIHFEGRSWEGDTRHIQGDITRARSVLGYSPNYSIERGIKEFVEAR